MKSISFPRSPFPTPFGDDRDSPEFIVLVFLTIFSTRLQFYLNFLDDGKIKSFSPHIFSALWRKLENCFANPSSPHLRISAGSPHFINISWLLYGPFVQITWIRRGEKFPGPLFGIGNKGKLPSLLPSLPFVCGKEKVLWIDMILKAFSSLKIENPW